MAQTVILAEHTYDRFYLNASFGIYSAIATGKAELIVGETYSVIWDGEKFICDAQDASAFLAGSVLLGNALAFGLSGNNEPFIILSTPYADCSDIISLTDTDANGIHTVAIYKDEPDSGGDDDIENGDEIVLKYFSGEEKKFSGIEMVELNTSDGGTQLFSKGEAVENVPIVLDFSEGDQIVTAPDGTLAKSAIIQKPPNLIPENIPEGIDIAGILGTRKDGGGDGVDETVMGDEFWIDDFCFWDLDGNLVRNIPVSEIQNLTDLPEAPTYDNMIFQEWNHTLDEIKSSAYPLDIAPIYSTADGKTHIKLTPYSTSYMAFKFTFSQTVANGVSFDFGDGSSAQTVSGTGVVSITHTYSAVKEYEVVITVSDGCVLTLGSATQSAPFLTGSTSTSYSSSHSRAITECRIADNVELSDYAFYWSTELAFLSFPKTIKKIPKYAFYNSGKIKCKAIPNGVSELAENSLAGCYSYIQSIGMAGPICIPQSVKIVGNACASNIHYLKRLVIPKDITETQNGFTNANVLQRIFLPDKIVAIGNGFLSNCHRLENIKLPDALVSIGATFMLHSSSLNDISIPQGVTSIGNSFMQYSGVREVFIPSNVTTIGTGPCGYSYGIKRIIMEDASKITSIGGNFPNTIPEVIFLSSIPPTSDIMKTFITTSSYLDIYVPDDAMDAYISVITSSEKKRFVRPLSQYSGILPTS